MAKKKATSDSISVSEHIRNAWDKDRSAKPAALVDTLKSEGVKTNNGTVATILSQYRKKLGLAPLRGKRKGKKAKAGKNGDSTGNGQVEMGTAVNNGRSVTSVIEAFKLVAKAKELVGADGLRELVKAV